MDNPDDTRRRRRRGIPWLMFACCVCCGALFFLLEAIIASMAMEEPIQSNTTSTTMTTSTTSTTMSGVTTLSPTPTPTVMVPTMSPTLTPNGACCVSQSNGVISCFEDISESLCFGFASRPLVNGLLFHSATTCAMVGGGCGAQSNTQQCCAFSGSCSNDLTSTQCALLGGGFIPILACFSDGSCGIAPPTAAPTPIPPIPAGACCIKPQFAAVACFDSMSSSACNTIASYPGFSLAGFSPGATCASIVTGACAIRNTLAICCSLDGSCTNNLSGGNCGLLGGTSTDGGVCSGTTCTLPATPSPTIYDPSRLSCCVPSNSSFVIWPSGGPVCFSELTNAQCTALGGSALNSPCNLRNCKGADTYGCCDRGTALPSNQWCASTTYEDCAIYTGAVFIPGSACGADGNCYLPAPERCTAPSSCDGMCSINNEDVCLQNAACYFDTQGDEGNQGTCYRCPSCVPAPTPPPTPHPTTVGAPLSCPFCQTQFPTVDCGNVLCTSKECTDLFGLGTCGPLALGAPCGFTGICRGLCGNDLLLPCVSDAQCDCYCRDAVSVVACGSTPYTPPTPKPTAKPTPKPTPSPTTSPSPSPTPKPTTNPCPTCVIPFGSVISPQPNSNCGQVTCTMGWCGGIAFSTACTTPQDCICKCRTTFAFIDSLSNCGT